MDKGMVDMVRKLNKQEYSPPICIIDSSKPIKKENLQRVINDAPLVKIGLPPLPVKMTDSAYLLTVGVPVQWREMMFEAMNNPDCRDDDPAVRRFSVNTNLDWRTVHFLVHLVRSKKTSTCYNTQGALSKLDESLICFDKCKWLISSYYKSILEQIARCTSDNLQDILDFDQTLRYKRSKRDPLVTCTTSTGSSFCHVGLINDKGQTEWLWLDISLSNDKPQKHPAEKRPSYAGPTCHTPGCSMATGLRRCSRCKQVFYCSNTHQKEDWPQHKSICK